jgi:tetratricopeptide (TPR) repeat protein
MRKTHITTTAAMAAIFLGAANMAAFAIPSGNGNNGFETVKPLPKSAKKMACKRTETAKRLKRNGVVSWRCVKLRADILPDAELYTQARLLADAGEYEWALEHLRLIKNQNEPEVLSYTGYANRKAGRLETGMAFYYRALAVNPDYVQAREYLGEAYVLAGFTPLAQQQLAEIAKRCGTQCEAFVTLQSFIQTRGI